MVHIFNSALRVILATSLVLSFILLSMPARAAETLPPVITHDAPANVQQPSVAFTVTVSDDTELAFVGFGPKADVLNNITMQPVSPGITSLALDESLTALAEGLNEYLVVAQDTSGNVTKAVIQITYQIPVTGNSTTFSDSTNTSTFDVWSVALDGVDTITITAPANTAIFDSNQNVVACVDSSNVLTLPVSALGANAPGFILMEAGSLTGVSNYAFDVGVNGPATPTVAATLEVDNASSFYATLLGFGSLQGICP